MKLPTSISCSRNALFENHVSIWLKFCFLALTAESNILKQWQGCCMQTVCFSFWSQVKWQAAELSTAVFVFPILGSRKVLQFESLAKFKFNYTGMKNDPTSPNIFSCELIKCFWFYFRFLLVLLFYFIYTQVSEFPNSEALKHLLQMRSLDRYSIARSGILQEAR